MSLALSSYKDTLPGSRDFPVRVSKGYAHVYGPIKCVLEPISPPGNCPKAGQASTQCPRVKHIRLCHPSG